MKLGWRYLGERGNAILSSMVVAGLVAGSAVVAYKSFNNTYSATRSSRMKGKLSVVEAQVRRRALQPEAYLDCNSKNLSSCHLNAGYFTDLGNQTVAGSRCGDGSTGQCGVAVTGLSFDPGSKKFRASVAYTGKEVNLKPTYIEMDIPVEVLQAQVFHCGERDKTKPIFTGFDSDGNPVCKGFDACKVGQFVRGVDVSKHTLVCKDLPAKVSCPSQQMFGRLAWSGEDVEKDCVDLPAPPFAANLSTRSSRPSGNGPGGTDSDPGWTGDDGSGGDGGGITVAGGGSGDGRDPASAAAATATDTSRAQYRWRGATYPNDDGIPGHFTSCADYHLPVMDISYSLPLVSGPGGVLSRGTIDLSKYPHDLGPCTNPGAKCHAQQADPAFGVISAMVEYTCSP